jgi:hypothetical protein
MSMNLNVEATIITTHEKLGKFEVRRTFDLWQTPTFVTSELLTYNTNPDLVDEYAKWCEKIDSEKQLSVAHIKALRQWLEDHKEWNIKFYEM